jgi:hypothetical protein
MISIFLTFLIAFTSISVAISEPHISNVSESHFPMPRIKMDGREVLKSQVSIRIIDASGSNEQNEQAESNNLNVDPRLEDLREKLNNLPYSEYRLNTEASKFISIKQKEPIRLFNGQRVYLRVIDYNNEEATVWIRWIGPENETLLDTRLGLVFNDAMVVGLDQISPESKGKGMVLAVKFSPIVTAR